MKIRARLATSLVTDEITATGTTLAQAVQHAAWSLGLGPGRTLSSERIDSHTWRWVWGRRAERYELVIRESRSGPGERGQGTRVVSVSLAHDVAERLDELARAAGVSRSGWVEARVREAADGSQE